MPAAKHVPDAYQDLQVPENTASPEAAVQAGISIAAKPGTVEYTSAPHLGAHKLTVKTH